MSARSNKARGRDLHTHCIQIAYMRQMNASQSGIYFLLPPPSSPSPFPSHTLARRIILEIRTRLIIAESVKFVSCVATSRPNRTGEVREDVISSVVVKDKTVHQKRHFYVGIMHILAKAAAGKKGGEEEEEQQIQDRFRYHWTFSGSWLGRRVSGVKRKSDFEFRIPALLVSPVVMVLLVITKLDSQRE